MAGKKLAKESSFVIKKTGIKELDEVLNGGIPQGHAVLLSGNTGTGKTILATQWLFEGYKKYKEPGVYITLTEPITKTMKILKSLSYYEENSVNLLDIFLTDLRSIISQLNLNGKKITKKDIDKIIKVITNIVENNKSKRLVLDSISAIAYLLENEELVRYFIFKLGSLLSNLDCTSILISEANENTLSLKGTEEFISDGVITLKYFQAQQKIMRHLNIVKMRGLSYRSGYVVYDVTKDGIKIFPKIPVDRSVAKTDFTKRVSTGIKTLDKMTGGGYPEGHIILLAGNTGSGKTTFCLEYLKEGIQKGEKVLFIALEESVTQIIKTSEAHNWNFQKYLDKNLFFLSPNMIDLYSDKLLYDILNIVKKNKIKRIVLDSISSLLSASMNKNELREFLLQLSSYFKSKGMSCVMTYLTEHMFGANKGSLLGSGASSELRLSSIVDGIILLRYIENNDSVNKLINVLKMRGSDHDKKIREFTVNKKGISISKKSFILTR